MSKRTVFNWIVASAIALWSLACNDILGIRAPSGAPDGGTAGSGGVGSGAAGTHGPGGTAGGGGPAGASGRGGAGTGSGGKGAAAGSGGSSTGGTSCPSGGTKCSDSACSSNTDPAHCGSGCTVCSGGTTCSNGACVCTVSGQQNCSGTCIDTMSNLNDCGSCGHTCTPGQSCSNGSCTCGASFAVGSGGFVTMPAAGGACWHGYAYNYADSNGTTIAPGTSSTYASCGTTCSLTAIGTVTAATAANSYGTFAGIGFNIKQDQSTGSVLTVTPAGSGLTITFTASIGDLSLRAQLYDGTTIWCYPITGASPVTIPYSSFNTKCYDTPQDGSAYAKSPINTLQLSVFGVAAAGAYSIALIAVTENN